MIALYFFNLILILLVIRKAQSMLLDFSRIQATVAVLKEDVDKLQPAAPPIDTSADQAALEALNVDLAAIGAKVKALQPAV